MAPLGGPPRPDGDLPRYDPLRPSGSALPQSEPRQGRSNDLSLVQPRAPAPSPVPVISAPPGLGKSSAKSPQRKQFGGGRLSAMPPAEQELVVAADGGAPRRLSQSSMADLRTADRPSWRRGDGMSPPPPPQAGPPPRADAPLPPPPAPIIAAVPPPATAAPPSAAPPASYVTVGSGPSASLPVVSAPPSAAAILVVPRPES
eukprot:Hpha_TRINITY_DN36938_c0_g1::TRINITY_DN36938_c0_g1_i1::g.170974::m.170974